MLKKLTYEMGIAAMAVLTTLVGHTVMVSRAAGAFTIQPVLESIPGMLLLLVLVLAGLTLKRYIPYKIPAIAYVVLLACVFTIPGFIPGAESISAAINKVNFMACTTPIQAYVGLSLAKDLPQMKKAGLPLLVVTALAIVGTFIGSAFVADVVLKLTGAI